MSQGTRQRRERPPVICLAPGQRLLILPARPGAGLGPLAPDDPPPAGLPELAPAGPGLYSPGPVARPRDPGRGFFLDRYVF